MLNNTALDVVIGLVFIYTLYSLFVTTLTELFCTFINLRASNLKRGIKRMLDDNDAEVFSEKLLNSPEIKFLGRRGLIFKKDKFPSYVQAKTFSRALFNVLKSTDKADEALSKIADNLKSSDSTGNSSPTKEFIYNLIIEADGKVDQFKKLLSEWYDETMERISGWYKKWMQLITLVFGLIIVVALNVDSIAIAKKLTNEGKTRTALVTSAMNYLENNTVNDSTATELISEKLENILNNIDETESILVMNRLDYSTANRNEKWLNILGFLLTTIALSLGAPFWFDLLNKLVKLRGAGVQDNPLTNKKRKKKK